jgi:hypothetical protein
MTPSSMRLEISFARSAVRELDLTATAFRGDDKNCSP